MVKLIGDRVVGLLDSQGIRPEGEAVELRMADGSTSQSRNRYCLNGLVDSRTHSWEAFHIPGLTSEFILGMKSNVDLDLIQINVPFEGHVLEEPARKRILDYVGVVDALPGDETR